MSKLIVIPARAGSKGLPGKNKRPLNDKPLIGYSFDFAKSVATEGDQICVSTNDQDVLTLAKEYGIEPDFVRSEALSSDNASMYDVLADALDFYERRGRYFDSLLLLQPTSPFREGLDFTQLAQVYEKGCDMAVTVSLSKENPYYTLMEEDVDGYLQKSKKSSFVRRQDCPEVYALNGSMYLINVTSLKDNGSLAFDKIRKSIMPRYRSVDIDNLEDFEYAEFLLARSVKKADSLDLQGPKNPDQTI